MAVLRNYECNKVTKVAYEDLSSYQFYAVVLRSDGTVELANATDDSVYGILQNAPVAGAFAEVTILGETYFRADAAVRVGYPVATAASGKAQEATGTQYAVGKCTVAAGAANDLCVVELFPQLSALTSITNAVLTCTAGATAATTALRFGKSVTEGLELKCIEEDVVFTTAVADKNLTNLVPTGVYLIGVQANLETTITATTAVKVGIGIKSGDVDVYGLFAHLVKNTKIDTMVAHAITSGTIQVCVSACATGGSAAGTLDSGTVKVRLYYLQLNSLDNAA